jgi:hypothetical protein
MIILKKYMIIIVAIIGNHDNNHRSFLQKCTKKPSAQVTPVASEEEDDVDEPLEPTGSAVGPSTEDGWTGVSCIFGAGVLYVPFPTYFICQF